LLHIHAKTLKEYVNISCSLQVSAEPPVSQQFRFKSVEDQQFSSKIALLQPFASKKAVNSADNLLEMELFGREVETITLRMHRFFTDLQSWHMSSEGFKEAFGRICKAKQAEQPRIHLNLFTNGEISMEDDWCFTAKRRRAERYEEDEDCD
jgi:hypothetical protein